MSGVAIGFAENDKKDDIKIKDSSTGKYIIKTLVLHMHTTRIIVNFLTERDMMFTMEEVQGGDSVFDKSQMKIRQNRPPPYFFSSNIK